MLVVSRLDRIQTKPSLVTAWPIGYIESNRFTRFRFDYFDFTMMALIQFLCILQVDVFPTTVRRMVTIPLNTPVGLRTQILAMNGLQTDNIVASSTDWLNELVFDRELFPATWWCRLTIDLHAPVGLCRHILAVRTFESDFTFLAAFQDGSIPKHLLYLGSTQHARRVVRSNTYHARS